jgi:hypothetical protein
MVISNQAPSTEEGRSKRYIGFPLFKKIIMAFCLDPEEETFLLQKLPKPGKFTKHVLLTV